MEAPNVGKHGGEENSSGDGNWPDLDLIYEYTPFLFISPSLLLSLGVPLSLSLPGSLCIHMSSTKTEI